MKNTIVYIVIILSYIFLMGFSSWSNVESRSNVFFSYLNGEIIFDYNPDMSLFHHYYNKINRISQTYSNFDFLLPTIDVKNDQRALEMNNKNILINLNVNDSDFKWTETDPTLPDLRELRPSDLFAAYSGHQENQNRSFKNTDYRTSNSGESGSFITAPCGPCNNFPLIFSNVSHLLEYSVGENSTGLSEFSGDGNIPTYGPTPEPGTFVLFGSVLIGFVVTTRIRRRKKE